MVADGTNEPAEPSVPAARLQAVIKLLYPEEMTPTAKRMLERVIAEYTH